MFAYGWLVFGLRFGLPILSFYSMGSFDSHSQSRGRLNLIIAVLFSQTCCWSVLMETTILSRFFDLRNMCFLLEWVFNEKHNYRCNKMPQKQTFTFF